MGQPLRTGLRALRRDAQTPIPGRNRLLRIGPDSRARHLMGRRLQRRRQVDQHRGEPDVPGPAESEPTESPDHGHGQRRDRSPTKRIAANTPNPSRKFDGPNGSKLEPARAVSLRSQGPARGGGVSDERRRCTVLPRGSDGAGQGGRGLRSAAIWERYLSGSPSATPASGRPTPGPPDDDPLSITRGRPRIGRQEVGRLGRRPRAAQPPHRAELTGRRQTRESSSALPFS